MPAGAAVDGEDPLAGVGGDRLEHLGDLDGQLTRRHQHQAERPGRFGAVEDPRQHRHAEGERLARPGAGPAADVASLHRHRDGLGLDLERLGEAGRGEAVVDPRRHAERGEPGRGLHRGQDGDGRQCGAMGGRLGPVGAAGRRTVAGGGALPAGGCFTHGVEQGSRG